MRIRLQTFIVLFMVVCSAMFLLSGCGDTSNDRDSVGTSRTDQELFPPGFDQFKDSWNKRNKLWLEDQIAAQKNIIAQKRERLSNITDASFQNTLEQELKEEIHSLDLLLKRQEEGDYIRFLAPSDIPVSLVWENGLDNPETGDPRARKGGTIRQAYVGSFPGTFRPIGPNSNDAFRGYLYDGVELGLVHIHPVTGNIIPGLAKEWAVGPDNRTVYYRLHEDATYSDGAGIKAIDFIVGLFITTSKYAQSPYHLSYYQEQISHICVYDDHTLSVTLPSPKPLLPYYASVFNAFPPHFYSEFGPNYVERYQWRVPPSTGAYTVDTENIVRGYSVTMKRVRDWWAADKPFYRYRYNADHILYHFISEESKALELFRVGEIDTFLLLRPELWYDQMEIPEVHKGYIKKATFYTIYPRLPLGIYLNVMKSPLNDLNVRKGFNHSMNIQKIIDTIYRGDYQRLGSFASGYGDYTDQTVKAREFSPEKAREFFARAGYTISGKDGILRKPDGARLEVELTYPNINVSLMNVMAILKEEAKKCGLDLLLDGLDSTVMFRKTMEKRHQSVYWSWGATPPLPFLQQLFFSGYARDEHGKPIPYTNNINGYADEIMDFWLMKERDAQSEAELKTASYAIQRVIEDQALWVPGWTMESSRIGFWRWVQWPNSDTTTFCYPMVFEPMESYLYWIDEEIKKETMDARKTGKSFPESEEMYDQFRFNGNNSVSKP